MLVIYQRNLVNENFLIFFKQTRICIIGRKRRDHCKVEESAHLAEEVGGKVLLCVFHDNNRIFQSHINVK